MVRLPYIVEKFARPYTRTAQILWSGWEEPPNTGQGNPTVPYSTKTVPTIVPSNTSPEFTDKEKEIFERLMMFISHGGLEKLVKTPFNFSVEKGKLIIMEGRYTFQ